MFWYLHISKCFTSYHHFAVSLIYLLLSFDKMPLSSRIINSLWLGIVKYKAKDLIQSPANRWFEEEILRYGKIWMFTEQRILLILKTVNLTVPGDKRFYDLISFHQDLSCFPSSSEPRVVHQQPSHWLDCQKHLQEVVSSFEEEIKQKHLHYTS